MYDILINLNSTIETLYTLFHVIITVVVVVITMNVVEITMNHHQMVMITMNDLSFFYSIVIPNNPNMNVEKLLICEPDILTY